MSSGGDAQITVGADASAVERAAAVAKLAWKDVGQSITSSIGAAAAAVANDLTRVATAQGQVNFSSQHQQVREFEAATARMATATGRDLESVRAQAEATGIAIGKRPAEVNQWSSEVGRLTYNFQGAEKSIRGFAELAALTGRSVDDYRGLAVELGSVGHVAGDSSHALGVMQAQAEMLGTVGGPAAFMDQIQGLQDTISHFAVKSEADFLRITAAAAALGKGLNPIAAQRVQQRALGFISQNVVAHERYLGHRITNDQGQVENPMQALLELRDKVEKQYGPHRSRTMLASMFGGDFETAAAVMGVKRSDVAAASGAAPSQAAHEAFGKYMGTDAAARDVAGAELAKSSRDLLGSSTKLGRAADALQQFAAHNPISSTFLSTAMGGALSAFMGSFGGSIAKMMGGKGEGGAVGGAIGLLTKGAGAGGMRGALSWLGGGAMAAGAGYAAGTWADETFGLSDRISGTGDHSRIASADARKDAARDAALGGRLDAVRRANAALHGSGLTGAEYHEAQEATQKVIQGKDALSALQFSHGGGGAMAALVAALHAQNKGMDDAAAQKIAAAMVAALKGDGALKVEVTNASDTPITAATKHSHSTAAGHQHG